MSMLQLVSASVHDDNHLRVGRVIDEGIFKGNGVVGRSKKGKERRNVMDQASDFKPRPEDYRNLNCLKLRKEDYHLDTLRKEAKNTLYYWFLHAHGMSSASTFIPLMLMSG